MPGTETQVLRVSKRSYKMIRYVRDRYKQQYNLDLQLIQILDRIIDNADLEGLFNLKEEESG